MRTYSNRNDTLSLMKVFISHQRADTDIALRVASRLSNVHAIPCYLDVIDPDIGKDGYELADHVKDHLDNCTQLLAVVSYATASSWWVPWEIGIATEKDFPLATYSESYSALPEYLHKWPYLKSMLDLDKYANAVKNVDVTFAVRRRVYANESFNESRKMSTRDFYRKLRKDLGQ